jgi:twitching motility protein PilT
VGNFPPQSQEIARHRIAEILVATVSLRLVVDKSGENLIPVTEVMYSTSTIKACIRDGHLDEIEQYIEKGRDEYGMQSFDQQLIQLCKKDIISLEEAKRISRSTDLERKLMYY